MNCSSGVNDDSVSGRDECVELARENPTFFVVVEVLQELEQLVLVAPEDGFDLWWLLWVRPPPTPPTPSLSQQLRGKEVDET